MLIAASLAIATLPGCAFIFSQGPPPPERQARETYFDCSESWVPTIVDALLTAGAGIAAGSAYNDKTLENPHDVAAVEAGLTALFAASAIYGVSSVTSCGRAKTARLERKQREELLPSPYGVPPWGQPPPYWPPPVAMYRAPAAAVAPKAAAGTGPPTPTPTPTPTEQTAPGAKEASTPGAPVFKPAPPAQ